MKLQVLAASSLLSILAGTAAAQLSPTLQVSGPHILDRCGNVLVLRGLEQNQTVNVNGGTIINGSWNAVVDQLDTTRANQMRIILEDVSVSQTRQMVERAVSKNLVVEIHTSIGYYNSNSVRQMVEANKSHLILGIFGEPAYEDRERWEQETMDALQTIRALGYDTPVLIMANLYGRDLPSVLEYGQTLSNADPLHKVIMGWQAYWGSTTNWYQTFYGMTFAQAMAQIAQKNFPVQVGLTYNADNPPDIIDYPQLMALTRQHGISTHFWDYYSRNALDQNKLVTRNMTTGVWSNTSLGQTVLITDPNSFWNQNAPRACTGTGVPCYVNCDNSSVAPVLNAVDFICFMNRYAAGDSYANCDGSTVAPVLGGNDFQCFLNRYVAGCS
jgi:hypothetical protein